MFKGVSPFRKPLEDLLSLRLRMKCKLQGTRMLEGRGPHGGGLSRAENMFYGGVVNLKAIT